MPLQRVLPKKTTEVPVSTLTPQEQAQQKYDQWSALSKVKNTAGAPVGVDSTPKHPYQSELQAVRDRYLGNLGGKDIAEAREKTLNRLREVVQGASFDFADEGQAKVGSYLKYGVPGEFDQPEVIKAREEHRSRKLKEINQGLVKYREESPWESGAFNMAGAIARALVFRGRGGPATPLRLPGVPLGMENLKAGIQSWAKGIFGAGVEGAVTGAGIDSENRGTENNHWLERIVDSGAARGAVGSAAWYLPFRGVSSASKAALPTVRSILDKGIRSLPESKFKEQLAKSLNTPTLESVLPKARELTDAAIEKHPTKVSLKQEQTLFDENVASLLKREPGVFDPSSRLDKGLAEEFGVKLTRGQSLGDNLPGDVARITESRKRLDPGLADNRSETENAFLKSLGKFTRRGEGEGSLYPLDFQEKTGTRLNQIIGTDRSLTKNAAEQAAKDSLAPFHRPVGEFGGRDFLEDIGTNLEDNTKAWLTKQHELVQVAFGTARRDPSSQVNIEEKELGKLRLYLNDIFSPGGEGANKLRNSGSLQGIIETMQGLGLLDNPVKVKRIQELEEKLNVSSVQNAWKGKGWTLEKGIKGAQGIDEIKEKIRLLKTKVDLTPIALHDLSSDVNALMKTDPSQALKAIHAEISEVLRKTAYKAPINESAELFRVEEGLTRGVVGGAEYIQRKFVDASLKDLSFDNIIRNRLDKEMVREGGQESSQNMFKNGVGEKIRNAAYGDGTGTFNSNKYSNFLKDVGRKKLELVYGKEETDILFGIAEEQRNKILAPVTRAVKGSEYIQKNFVNQSLEETEKAWNTVGKYENGQSVFKNGVGEKIRDSAYGDGTGIFNSNKYSNFLKDVGRKKLELVFGKEDADVLFKLERVARLSARTPYGGVPPSSVKAMSEMGLNQGQLGTVMRIMQFTTELFRPGSDTWVNNLPMGIKKPLSPETQRFINYLMRQAAVQPTKNYIQSSESRTLKKLPRPKPTKVPVSTLTPQERQRRAQQLYDKWLEGQSAPRGK